MIYKKQISCNTARGKRSKKMKADKKRHGRRVSILLIITLLFSMVLPAAVFAEDGESVKYSETITIFI